MCFSKGKENERKEWKLFVSHSKMKIEVKLNGDYSWKVVGNVISLFGIRFDICGKFFEFWEKSVK